MEKTIRVQKIVIAVLAVLLLFNMFAVMQLKEDVKQLNNNALNGIQDVRSSVNTILSEIRSIQDDNEAQLSLVTAFDYKYGELDKNKMTVPVSVKIVPKSVSDDTSLSLEFGGRTVEMQKSDSSTEFAADFQVKLFEQRDSSAVKLVIKENGVSQTQELEWSLGSLHFEFLPWMAAGFVFSDINLVSDGIRVEGKVVAHIQNEDTESFRNIRLIYKVNGKAVDSEKIDDLDLYDVTKILSGYGEGDTLELYLEAEDEYGFIHETMIKKVMFAGETTEESESDSMKNAVIKDKKGNVLYS